MFIVHSKTKPYDKCDEAINRRIHREPSRIDNQKQLFIEPKDTTPDPSYYINNFHYRFRDINGYLVIEHENSKGYHILIYRNGNCLGQMKFSNMHYRTYNEKLETFLRENKVIP